MKEELVTSKTSQEITELITKMANQSGLDIIRIRKPFHTNSPSIQGQWHPFTNRPPRTDPVGPKPKWGLGTWNTILLVINIFSPNCWFCLISPRTSLMHCGQPFIWIQLKKWKPQTCCLLGLYFSTDHVHPTKCHHYPYVELEIQVYRERWALVCNEILKLGSKVTFTFSNGNDYKYISVQNR